MHSWMKLKTMMKSKKKGTLRITAILLIVLLIGIFGSFFFYKTSLNAVGKDIGVEFTVSSGETINGVLTRLEQEGLIQNSFIAKLYIKLNGGVALKAGTYDLHGYMDVETILATLSDATKAHTNDVAITFIEGDWCKHIAAKVAEVTNVSEEELLALWNDESYIRSLMSEYPFLTEAIFNEDSRYYLEGYLMPNTYKFSPETTADAVTRKLLDQSLRVYEKYAEQMKASSMSIHEIYTLASIVQYEASKVEDMKLIAGVFYNRLHINMALQSSVTVCYAIDMDRDDDWKNCETNPNYDSPYNTYRVNGLPPGPILNPGEAAIEATLNPTASEYYYFLADVYGDGTVYYSRTYDEHLAYKAKYLD